MREKSFSDEELRNRAEDERVHAEEKPEFTSLVSMGIYVLEPEVLHWIPEGQQYDFPDLVHALLEADEPVGVYPYHGLWLDIGRPDDYAEALRMEEEVAARCSWLAGRS